MKTLETICAALLAIATIVSTTTAHADTRPLPAENKQERSSPRAVSPPGPLIYIRDYNHLAEVTKEDDLISGMARRLAARRTVAYGLELGALVPLTLTMLSYKSPNQTLFYSGLVVSTAAMIAGLAVMPRSRDLYEVVNTWNERHVDRPVSIAAASTSDGNQLF